MNLEPIDFSDLKRRVKIADEIKSLERYVDKIIIEGKENFDKIRDKQVVYLSNHLSHMDYILYGYTFIKNSLPYPRFIAGVNLDFFPFNRFFPFKNWGACFIDRKKISMNGRYRREKKIEYLNGIDLAIKNFLLNGDSLLQFPEGGRSYSGEVMEKIKTGILSSILDIAKERELYGVDIAINYDKRVEEGFFDRLKKAHDKRNIFGKWEYYFWDFYAFFIKRPLLKNKGNAYMNFGKPYLIDFKNKKQFADFLQNDIRKLYNEVQT